MIAIEQFGMDPEQNGMMLSYIGVISLFMQGIGISTLTKRAEDKVLMALSTVTLTVAYFVMVRKNLISLSAHCEFWLKNGMGKTCL